ncbi:uncharacterized protein KY384_008909 [Bacidia gigantensis]|uniref:uncharacterized protein n=1 Tax=Bacidia gigantensis TaxID=2732470 RepID=UPI001D05216C|nr:uncharacterized protein KY384_008909 [Bacidia gigantensis]KAG8525265.1 hypothetical protein KY384_008909 [Bacidia gigantensis]
MFATPRQRHHLPAPFLNSSKRRKLSAPVESINFDPSARQEYLTGFHKRKQARMKHGQEVAAKKAREEKIQARKAMRDQRKAELADRLKAMEGELRGIEGLENEDRNEDKKGSGLSEDDDIEIGDVAGDAGQEEMNRDREDEYVDEDRFTTVTVEEVGIDRDGFHQVREDEEEDKDAAMRASKNDVSAKSGDTMHAGKRKGGAAVKTKKRKKFRYESKAERKLGKQKQKLRNGAAKARREGRG